MTLPRICSHRTSHLVTRCPIGHLRDHQRIAESMSDVRHFFRCQLLLMLDLKRRVWNACQRFSKFGQKTDFRKRRVGDGCVRKVNTRFFYDCLSATTAKEKRGAILLHTGNGNRAIKMDLKMSGMPEPQSNREESQSSELPVGEKCTVGWETWH